MGEFNIGDLVSPIASNRNCNCAATPIPVEEMIRSWRK
jgi:hypothetical protein